MKFEDKYCNATELDPKKIEISNDAYAIGDMIEKLIIKIEHVRITK